MLLFIGCAFNLFIIKILDVLYFFSRLFYLAKYKFLFDRVL
jgi:hypothetical protein